ncbi:tandem-95 repeat protein [Desulfuromonas acetoxidans]|uniref:Tandem-95 repeat protein n=1 Tax=Desulfuromonas acetoxidans (strain DSM 684 / 11070) TaxID=281689 RepID=Q1JZ79_DESA6|nr:cadherin-like domain-containing protein [Desulfuromonas acetoxidans]EAT15688.1 conserved hypothetical protein [Desulfuromonas acetoxidans DSM 684]MBF0645460.1 tandem-95 repeat protein [Desulfuromonas acetoxidans]NVD25339.1 tandem-95 repeat protein [Desulfuromonas acetoxidans]NVE17391.1 tandem-95 repeat protein [Desulfuromonas acetoxidans]
MADELKLNTTNEEMISQAAEPSAAVQANPEAAQPESMITLPEPGTVAVVPVQAGQEVPVAFDLNDVQMSVVGGDLQLDFGNGTLLMLEDFATASAGDNPPTLVLGDGTMLPGDAIVFASAETDFAPAAGPTLTSGGVGEYRTDFGEVIEGVDRLGVQGPTSLGENQETVLEDTSIVLDENDPPDALDDTITMAEDTTAVIPVLTNDSDPDGDPLTIIDLGSAQNGTVTLNDNGSVTYTPNENYNGDDSFTYTISDGQGGTDTATVYITVEPANDPPDAVNDATTTDEDTSVIIPVLNNDTDLDGDTLSVENVTQGQNGQVQINEDGTVTYTPNENFNGSDTFTYTITDGQGGTDTATVTVTIAAVNDAPVAADDFYATDEDVALVVDGSIDPAVLANDNDLDLDTLTVNTTPITDVSNGTLTLNGDGTFTYTPDANFNGNDSFVYQVSDGAGGTAQATAYITVNPVNDAPVAADDFYNTNEDVALVVDGTIDPTVLANDNDLDLDTLTVNTTPITDVANGTLTLNADGTFTYAPDANFNGNDSFVYQVSDGAGGTAQATAYITVIPVNDAPAAADDYYTTDEDITLEVDGSIDPTILANDNDIDLDTLTVNTTPITDVANGSLTLNADGTFTYTPDENFSGNDSFVYQISDGAGGTAQATVYIAVNPVNDAPEADDDFYSTNEDVALVVDGTIDPTVLANDNDLDLDTLTVNTTPLTDVANGTLTLNADGTFTYTPDANFNGNDSFVYQISDGAGGTAQATAYITVLPVNDAPAAADDFYSTNEDVALVVDGTIDPTVLANDNDLDLDTLTVNTTPLTDVANGTLTLNADGTFTYTPDANFNGNDSFVYQISDGAGGTAQATAYITVVPVNDAPVAADDFYSTNEDVALVVDGTIDPTVLANDNDLDLDTLTVNTTPLTDVANGSLVLNADGTFTYTPDANFNGNDSFVYQISDGAGGTAQATAYITVIPVNDAPVAVADNNTITELADDIITDNEVTGNVLTGASSGGTDSIDDNDPSGDSLFADFFVVSVDGTPVGDGATDVTIVGDYGTLTISGDGSYTYELDDANTTVQALNTDSTPLSDVFSYIMNDGDGGTDGADLTITVNGTNDSPIAVADNNVITELADDIVTDNEVTGNVLTGASSGGTDSIDDNDPSGDSLFGDFFVASVDGTNVGDAATDVTIIGDYGTLTISGDGSYTYELDDANTTVQALNTDSTPLSDVFSYTLNDGDGGTDSANLTITINGTDDAATLTAATNTTVSEEGLTYGNLDTLPDGYTLLPDDDPLNNPNDNTNLVVNSGSFTLTDVDSQYTMDSISLATDATVKTADGVDITFNWVDGDNALIGSRDDNGDEVIRISVQSVTPNLDNYEVAYQVTLSEAIEHPFVGDGSGVAYDESSATEDDEDELSLFIDVTAGDTTFTDAFSVTVEDDSPLNIMPDAAELPNLPLGTFTGNLDFDGQIEDNIGADQPGSVQFPVALEALTDTGLTSGGLNINYDVSADGQTLTAYTVAGTVFTIALNVDGAGSDQYTINMIGTVDGGATSIDFNAGGYNFVGGNGAWAGFSTEADDNSLDLLLTPIGAGTVNTNANEGGVGGGNSVGPGEAIRADFVVDLTGDPKGTPYTDAANQDHVFDSHYEVNGASALFTHTAGSTVLIKAYDDADGNDVGDGVQDDITAIGISYGGEEIFVSSALGNSQTVTLDGNDFDVTFDGSDVQVAGVFEGVALSAFTADGYNSIEFWHDGGETFKIGDFGTTVTEPGQSVEFSVPLDIYDADGDMAAGTIDVVLTPDSDIGTASTLQALMVEDPMIYEFSANGGEGDLVIDGFDVNQDVIRLTDVLDLDTDGSLDSGDVSVGVFADGNDLVLTISGQDGVDTNVTLADVGSYQGVDSLDSLAQAGFQVEYSS